jgi:hypothetical protein
MHSGAVDQGGVNLGLSQIIWEGVMEGVQLLKVWGEVDLHRV